MPANCAYCGNSGNLTREHVLPSWLRAEMTGSMTVSPALGRHQFGGELVVEDVCDVCNNVLLGRLDEAAKAYWEARGDEEETIDAAVASVMARWACKVAYNAQRAVFLHGTAGEEPPFPASVRNWALNGGAAPPDVAIVVARLPLGHRDADGAGVFGSNRTPLPRRYVHLRASVWFVSWDPPSQAGIGNFVAEQDSLNLPAVRVGRSDDDGPIRVPVLRDPDVVRRGFWSNPDLLRRIAERWTRS